MKHLTKKPLWFTVITTLCLVIVVLFADSGCEKPEYHTVNFTGEGIAINPQSVEHGKYATAPKNPEKEDYDFAGWFTDNGTFTNQWNFKTDIVMQDMTLYAKWEENASQETISGTWEVKSISMSGVLTNIGLPSDSFSYSNILIKIPDMEKGYINGNTFYSMIEFDFETTQSQQIHIYNCKQYVENELLVHLKMGVDATEFAVYSKQGITPQRCLSQNLNIWLFETDGTIPLRTIVSNLSQHLDVITVSYNNAGITIREEVVNSFMENMHNTVKFSVSNNELRFMDSLNNILIVFINPLNKN